MGWTHSCYLLEFHSAGEIGRPCSETEFLKYYCKEHSFVSSSISIVRSISHARMRTMTALRQIHRNDLYNRQFLSST